MNAIKIFPSLMSSDLLNIERTMVELEPYCDGFHIDVMDNHFVANLAFGPLLINQIASRSTKPLSIHLMVENPLKVIEKLKLRPESVVVFHVESNGNKDEIISCIKNKKLLPSIALKPQTSDALIIPYLHKVEQLLIMSVEPGFSGQKFLYETYKRLEYYVNYKNKHSLPFEIAMDGGINHTNIHRLMQLGCATFCIASAIFDVPDSIAALKELYAEALEN